MRERERDRDKKSTACVPDRSHDESPVGRPVAVGWQQAQLQVVPVSLASLASPAVLP